MGGYVDASHKVPCMLFTTHTQVILLLFRLPRRHGTHDMQDLLGGVELVSGVDIDIFHDDNHR